MSSRRYGLIISAVVLLTLAVVLVFKDRIVRFDDSQIKLEQKTQQIEATLNNFLIAKRKLDKPSGAQLINRSFYKLPPEVEKARQDSVVVVRFRAARITNDKMSTIELASSGFVVNDSGAIITALHTLGDVPADWSNLLSSVEVHDGKKFFDARLDKYDWVADLAMLQIQDWPNSKHKFQKHSINFVLNANGNLETINNFYGFCFIGGSEEVVHNLPVIFGPYLGATNMVSGEVKPVAFGFVGGPADTGCSGSPLVGPEGGAYGVLSRTTDMHVYVVTLDELFNFIQSDQLAITKRLISAQNGN